MFAPGGHRSSVAVLRVGHVHCGEPVRLRDASASLGGRLTPNKWEMMAEYIF